MPQAKVALLNSRHRMLPTRHICMKGISSADFCYIANPVDNRHFCGKAEHITSC